MLHIRIIPNYDLCMTDNMKTISEKLTAAGLRPTRQRLAIGDLLFCGQDKHFTAEDLHRDILLSGKSVSLATIYNTLGVFTEAGLLHTVSVEGGRLYYDTNTNPHYHLYDEDSQKLADVNLSDLELRNFAKLPEGHVVDRIDVIIRTKTAG